MSFSGGFLVGPIWGGFLTERAGWAVMVSSLGGIAAASAVVVLLFVGGGPPKWNVLGRTSCKKIF